MRILFAILFWTTMYSFQTISLEPPPPSAPTHMSYSNSYFWRQLPKLTYKLLWGLRDMNEICLYGNTIMRVNQPFSEHVDIFPVRLVPTFHWVFSVYLILAIYLHSRLLSLRAEWNTMVGSFSFSIKESWHIHKWHGTFAIVIQQFILWLSLLVRVEMW